MQARRLSSRHGPLQDSYVPGHRTAGWLQSRRPISFWTFEFWQGLQSAAANCSKAVDIVFVQICAFCFCGTSFSEYLGWPAVPGLRLLVHLRYALILQYFLKQSWFTLCTFGWKFAYILQEMYLPIDILHYCFRLAQTPLTFKCLHQCVLELFQFIGRRIRDISDEVKDVVSRTVETNTVFTQSRPTRTTSVPPRTHEALEIVDSQLSLAPTTVTPKKRQIRSARLTPSLHRQRRSRRAQIC
ncbi:Hypothetical_protein [Hexamita inflata]|uniref:Hypothetical_protein n=1 Tax=Hexamita inflata TaxID=28002 RepID=A0AA86P9R6_9EUKA|nr:Hypothetical protein HINF_LOCUS21221 [Hexamita inflata]